MGQELLNVVTIVGTRPEIIRLSRVISRLNESKSIKHTLIHTGQNYDYNLNQVFFEELEVKKPDIFLTAFLSKIIISFSKIFSFLTKMASNLRSMQVDGR